MKILYITNGINGAGGLERVLSIKASYLTDVLNYDITILSLNDQDINPFYHFSKNIKTLSISVSGNKISYFIKYKRGIDNIVKLVNPDIISVCDDGLKGFLIPSFLKTTIPIIYERHASILLNFKNKSKAISSKLKKYLTYKIMYMQAKKFDRFILLTNGNLKEWDNRNTCVIPNPLSFDNDKSSDLNKKRIIAVGSHSFLKGYDLLLESWKLAINQLDKEWELVIFGKFDSNNTYLKLAKELNIQERITFLEPVKDIKKEYLDSSIFVLPSRSEGFGMVLIEAMACGLPVISFNCPHGPADIITNGLDGYLIENGNVFLMAEKIIHLANNKVNRLEMGANAKLNSRKYDVEVILNKWDNLFKNLIS